MTINSIQQQETTAAEKPPVTVQNEIHKEAYKEAVGEEINYQKNLIQMIASAQPQQQIQQTAQNQIARGFLDVRV